MSELLNFPFVNQLKSPTLDGKFDENAQFNCVPASICAGLRYLTGNNSFEPDQLKDWAYGEGWVNSGTAASAFVGFCEQHGVKLFNVGHSTPLEAVSDAHTWLARGMPVIFTQQDDYSSQAGFTHVCVWYKDAPGLLTAMDPFGAKSLTYPDAIWVSRLRSTELWIMQKENNMGVPQGWHDNGTILTAPNNIPVKLGFRQYVLTHNWDANNYPLAAEEGLSQLELSNPALGGGTWQPFRWTVLEWTAQRGVFEMWTGQELLAVRNLVATLQTQIKTLQDQATTLQAQIKTLQDQLAQAQGSADLASQIANLKNCLKQINTLSQVTA